MYDGNIRRLSRWYLSYPKFALLILPFSPNLWLKIHLYTFICIHKHHTFFLTSVLDSRLECLKLGFGIVSWYSTCLSPSFLDRVFGGSFALETLNSWVILMWACLGELCCLLWDLYLAFENMVWLFKTLMLWVQYGFSLSVSYHFSLETFPRFDQSMGWFTFIVNK